MERGFCQGEGGGVVCLGGILSGGILSGGYCPRTVSSAGTKYRHCKHARGPGSPDDEPSTQDLFCIYVA